MACRGVVGEQETMKRCGERASGCVEASWKSKRLWRSVVDKQMAMKRCGERASGCVQACWKSKRLWRSVVEKQMAMKRCGERAKGCVETWWKRIGVLWQCELLYVVLRPPRSRPSVYSGESLRVPKSTQSFHSTLHCSDGETSQ
ncbi:hypothetical protein Pmani_009433 [Petrolisthes manimaculis]|uniref:Uncharacterized protein n=1 Tax=Petrolisthes manimaculis TaxID=1843537 RepID=A0AAE1Q3J3_9EUCA|nr:hypothetical protein Pmani_009433 [Petrolisthes manimaculis]